MAALFKSGQWHFHQDNKPVHNSILVTDYLTKMGIKTVLQPPDSPDISPCDFWLFPKLRGCRYEIIEEIKEAVTNVIDMLTQEDFYGALPKLLERYNNALQPESGFELTKKRSRRYPSKTIIDADYADDIAILANTPDQAETLLQA